MNLLRSHITNLFFELIQISIHKRDRFVIAPTEQEWHELLRISIQQTLVGVLYTAIERLEIDQRPPFNIAAEWFTYTHKIELSNIVTNNACSLISTKFKNMGFLTCILKGQGLATLYPNPLRRICGDIDVWTLPKKDIIQNRSLSLAKRRNQVMNLIHRFFPTKTPVYHHVDFPILNDSSVEVHFTPTWMNNYFINRRLQNWFTQEIPVQFGNEIAINLKDSTSSITVPTLSFNYVFILIHIYRHLFAEGIGLRQVMDYYYVVVKFTEVAKRNEKDNVLRLLQEFGLVPFYQAVLWILQKVFLLPMDCMLLEPDESEGEFLLNEIMIAGNFGRYDIRQKQKFEQGTFTAFIQRLSRNLRFLSHYPSEVIWSPFFKIWHQIWQRIYTI